MKTKRITKRELIFKSVFYRGYVIIYEVILYTITIPFIGSNVVYFIILNNLIKIIGYFLYDIIWFDFLRTKFTPIINYLKKKVKNEN
jgi:hypothetical protein